MTKYNIKHGTIIKPDTDNEEEKEFLWLEEGWIFHDADVNIMRASKNLFFRVLYHEFFKVARHSASGYYSVDEMRDELWFILSETIRCKFSDDEKDNKFENRIRETFYKAIQDGLSKPKMIKYHTNRPVIG